MAKAGLVIFGVLAVIAVIAANRLAMPSKNPDTNRQGTGPTAGIGQSLTVSTLAGGLDTPWSLVFLPDQRILVMERPGIVKMVDQNGNLSQVAIITSKPIRETAEGGLLGAAAHPDFATNHYIYCYYTYQSDKESLANRVVRLKFDNNTLWGEEIVVDNIPANNTHNGGRIKFGPDGYLYISTGDAQKQNLAQDPKSLAGKILRVNDGGKAVTDNPFGNEVFSIGHRNPEGFAWDKNGLMWETEHGNNGNDEINIIQKGENYGWPLIEGEQTKEGLITPIITSGKDTWAPAGAEFSGDSLFFGGLRGQTLYRMVIDDINRQITLLANMEGAYGRIREVGTDSRGNLYFTTSNRDGRGSPSQEDDRILVVESQ
jgi:glucose/arabinose dehydrogenase